MFGEHPYVKWAIYCVEKYIMNGIKVEPPETLPEELFVRRAGCFVSLHKVEIADENEETLRGCIGTIMPAYDNLSLEIRENAINAAISDPRFPPLTEEELDNIQVNVDILSELEPIDSLEDLDPLYYGVVVVSGWRKGVLLPDLDGIDTVEKQLAIAKRKAGIFSNEPIQIYRFTVERLY